MLEKLYVLKKKAGNHEEGFTLLELMIVIVIIGILAAIAILIFANQQKSAIEAGVKSDTVNARSVIPATPHGVKTPERFATEVTITEDNLGRYFVNQTQSEACYDVSRIVDTETFVYRYVTNIGKIEAASCDDWVTNNPGGSSISIESTPTGPETSSPAVTIPTPNNGNASNGGNNNGGGVGGGDYGATTNPYISATVGINSMNMDWNGVYTASVQVVPKQNSVINWSITWVDPSVTGIQDVNNMNCSVATGGIITCSGLPNHYSTQNFQWGQTFNHIVHLQTTDKTTAPANPTVYIAAEPA